MSRYLGYLLCCTIVSLAMINCSVAQAEVKNGPKKVKWIISHPEYKDPMIQAVSLLTQQVRANAGMSTEKDKARKFAECMVSKTFKHIKSWSRSTLYRNYKDSPQGKYGTSSDDDAAQYILSVMQQFSPDCRYFLND